MCKSPLVTYVSIYTYIEDRVPAEENIMPVDSPEYIERQRGNKGGGSTLFWIFLIVIILACSVFMGQAPK